MSLLLSIRPDALKVSACTKGSSLSLPTIGTLISANPVLVMRCGLATAICAPGAGGPHGVPTGQWTFEDYVANWNTNWPPIDALTVPPGRSNSEPFADPPYW